MVDGAGGPVLMEMAMLHVRGYNEDVAAACELTGDAPSPTRSQEVVGVRGRVQEMVLRFSVSSSG